MNLRTRLALAVPAALALAALAVPPAASAATHTHHAPLSTFNPGDGHEYLTGLGNGQYGITAEGVGAQVQTTTTPTAWNTTAATHGYKVMPNGNSGHCLAQSGVNLVIQNCSSGNTAQWFTFNGTPSSANIINWGTGQYVGVFDPNSLRPVYVEAEHSGFYVSWAV